MKYLLRGIFLAVLILFNGVPLTAQNSNSEVSKMSLIFSAGAVFGAVCGWLTYKTFVHKRAELIANESIDILKRDLNAKIEDHARLKKLNTALIDRLTKRQKNRDDKKTQCILSKAEKNSRRFEQRNRQKHMKFS